MAFWKKPCGGSPYRAEILLLFFRLNFKPEQKLALAGTIQFAASLQAVREQLSSLYPSLAVPQSRPLSPGASYCSLFKCQMLPVAGPAHFLLCRLHGMEMLRIRNQAS